MHSIETSLTSTLTDVYSSIDSGSSSILVSLDISAAFDMVPRDILLTTFKNTVLMDASTIEWFQSYLSSRTQSIHLNGQLSQTQPALSGVPQGSVLGSLLFMTYISPIANLLKSFNVEHQQYADDTLIYISTKSDFFQQSVDNLENCLYAVKSWFAHNAMSLNPTKSKTIIITTPQRLLKLKSLG